MKIGLISDTHDHLEHIKKAVSLFKEHQVSYVIHAGDFVSPAAIKAFEGIKLIGIFGNNDGDAFRMLKVIQQQAGELKGDCYTFEEEGVSFAVYHGTEEPLKNALIHCGRYDVVICGHTHQVEDQMIGQTRYLNPGTANGFGKAGTFMIYDTTTQQPQLFSLE
ncbi:metallophosphoesterase [Deltaproteobacteria bacterium TL4]